MADQRRSQAIPRYRKLLLQGSSNRRSTDEGGRGEINGSGEGFSRCSPSLETTSESEVQTLQTSVLCHICASHVPAHFGFRFSWNRKDFNSILGCLSASSTLSRLLVDVTSRLRYVCGRFPSFHYLHSCSLPQLNLAALPSTNVLTSPPLSSLVLGRVSIRCVALQQTLPLLVRVYKLTRSRELHLARVLTRFYRFANASFASIIATALQPPSKV